MKIFLSEFIKNPESKENINCITLTKNLLKVFTFRYSLLVLVLFLKSVVDVYEIYPAIENEVKKENRR